ncbi:hypothetical protein KY285_007333 [Solanum tuberosum]|nr:hypothetical protein KY285_007333 [Solanum tuberosum]
MENFHYSRRLLPESTMAPPPAAGISHYTTNHQPFGHKVNTFDANVIMVLAVLVHYPNIGRLILKPYK